MQDVRKELNFCAKTKMIINQWPVHPVLLVVLYAEFFYLLRTLHNISIPSLFESSRHHYADHEDINEHEPHASRGVKCITLKHICILN